MSRQFEPSDEFVLLLQSVLDGSLTSKGHQRLEALLREQPQAQSFFADYMHLHASLQYEAVKIGMQEQSSEALLPASSREAKGSSRRAQDSAPGQGVLGKKLFGIVTWAIAAVLMISVCLSYLVLMGDSTEPDVVASAEIDEEGGLSSDSSERRTSIRPPKPVATLASQEDAKWRETALVVGQSLHEGSTVHLEQGKARLSVGYGAEIVAIAPCSLTFLAKDNVHLADGEVLVDVAEWAQGFTVSTDKMDVVDLGTTFQVSASSSEATTETTVLEGMVRAQPTVTHEGDQRSLLLSEGEGLFVDALGRRKTFQYTPEEPIVFDHAGLSPYRPVELHNTGIGLSEGDQDPYWRVIAGPEGAFHGPEYAQVCVPYKRYLENDPTESQWVSMRNWEKALPNSTFTFETKFHLAGYDLATMRLFGRFLADNGVEAVRVNGRAVRVESWTDNVYGQRFDGPQFRFVNVTEGLVEGENVIQIDVWNGTMVNRGTGKPDNSPNHMALRVEWYAFGRGTALAEVEGNKSESIGTPSTLDLKSTLNRSRPDGFRAIEHSADSFKSAFLSRSTDSFGMN